MRMRIVFAILIIIGLSACQHAEKKELTLSKFDIKNDSILDPNNPFYIRDSIKNYAQIPQISTAEKTKVFKSYIDSLQLFQNSDDVNKFQDIEKFNYLIIKYINHFINDLGILPSFFAKSPISYKRFFNGKLGILSWDENTGGVFDSKINILCYRKSDRKYASIHLEWINHFEEFMPYGGIFENIYLLSREKETEKYMLHSSGTPCSHCNFDAFIGFEIYSDTINFDVEMFLDKNRFYVENSDTSEYQLKYLKQTKEIEMEHFHINDRNFRILSTYKWQDSTARFELENRYINELILL